MVSASNDRSVNGEPAPESGGDLDALARVIRRHAEELARISGRMSGTAQEEAAVLMPVDDKPPRRAAAPPVLRRDAGGLPSLADDPALSAESLPVLNAFRQFVEAERRRARTRMVWMGVGFALLLAGVLAGAWLGLRRYQAAMRGEISLVRGETAQRIEQAETALRQVTEAAEGMNHKLDGALSSTRADIESQINEKDTELKELREALVALQIEQALLQGAVSAMPREEAGTFPAPETPREDAPDETLPLRELPLVIRPGGAGRPVQFRLPLGP